MTSAEPPPVGAAPEVSGVAEASDAVVGFPRWQRDVTLFLSGQTVSLFGSMLVQYAVTWYITLETKNATYLTFAAVFGFLPQAVISVFGGVWADRHNRKFLVMGADACIALATLALALVMMNGNTNIWLIFAAMAVRSAGAGIQTPAVGALIPQIVPPNQLLRINGLNQSIQAGMMIVAPALAAVLYAAMPIERIFFVDVVTAVIGIGLLALIPVQAVVRSDGEAPAGYLRDLVEGVRYISTQRLVRWVLGVNAVVMVLAGAPSFLTPLMVARTFGEEVWKLTGLELAFSIGMMLAGATIGLWGHRFKRVTLLLGSALLFGMTTIGLGLSPTLWVFYGFMFIFGVAVPAFTTPAMTVLQEVVPAEKQGRVFGFVGIVMAVSMPLGMGIFGPLADVWSVQVVLVLAGGLSVLATVYSALVPIARESFGAAHERGHALAFGASGGSRAPSRSD